MEMVEAIVEETEAVQAEDAGGLERDSGIAWIQSILRLGVTLPGLADELDPRMSQREQRRI